MQRPRLGLSTLHSTPPHSSTMRHETEKMGIGYRGVLTNVSFVGCGIPAPCDFTQLSTNCFDHLRSVMQSVASWPHMVLGSSPHSSSPSNEWSFPVVKHVTHLRRRERTEERTSYLKCRRRLPSFYRRLKARGSITALPLFVLLGEVASSICSKLAYFGEVAS